MLKAFVFVAAIVGLVAAQDCCIGNSFQIKTAMRGFGTLLSQNTTLDYNANSLRADEAGTLNNRSLAGTAWLFGPNSAYSGYGFYQDTASGYCSKFPYAWTQTQFCTNSSDFERVDKIFIADTRSTVWYSSSLDQALVIADNTCTPIESISNYSSLTGFLTETYYDYFPGRINPSVFTPCTPTDAAPEVSDLWRFAF
eukprot:TRINITY_DN2752_c0_g1_i1.p2 TRINITY_DN2752_c0_g1~~TRINITY_DN2752_c0_g1_i1.p2  ORF type:complete len:197 (+),score=58.94 TRINITY_DN2752_c0_g1_i1:77-667(+)